MSELDRLVWAATSTFRIGPVHVGVRSSSEEVDLLLRELLADHVADVAGAPANYSVIAAPPSADRGARRRVHQLFRSSHAVARHRGGAAVVRALLNHLSAHAAPVDEGLLAMRAVALVSRDGRAVLAPAALMDDLAHVEPRLRRQGLRMVDAQVALVDPTSAELVVPRPSLTLDPAGLDRLAEWEMGEPPEESVAPGRYPLLAWALFAGEPFGPMSPARARTWAYPATVRTEGIGVRGTLDRLDQLLNVTKAHSVASALPALATHLGRLASAP